MLLVEAPISAFPDDSLDLDLPKGAKDCLAALKRLKPDSSAETKETFLGKWFRSVYSSNKWYTSHLTRVKWHCVTIIILL